MTTKKIKCTCGGKAKLESPSQESFIVKCVTCGKCTNQWRTASRAWEQWRKIGGKK